MLTVSNSQNIFHHQRNREHGLPSRVSTYKDYLLKYNMERSYLSEIIYGEHNTPIFNLDVKDALAATLSFDNNVKLWDLDLNKCLWSFTPHLASNNYGIIKIVGDRIVFSGTIVLEDRSEQAIIQILDQETGQEMATINDPGLIEGKTCLVGERIFCLRNDLSIGEWNLNGKFIRPIPVKPFQKFEMKDINGFLVYQSDHSVTVHDPAKDESRTFVFPNYKKSDISFIHLDKERLIAGYSLPIENPCMAFCIVDLATHKKSTVWLPINYGYPCLKTNSINHILHDQNQNTLYIAHSSGKIVIYNLKGKSHSSLEEHKTAVRDMALCGQILLSRSVSHCKKHPEQIMFWDTKAMEMLSAISFHRYGKVHFTSEKIFVALDESFREWNYLVSHATQAFDPDNDSDDEDCTSLEG